MTEREAEQAAKLADQAGQQLDAAQKSAQDMAASAQDAAEDMSEGVRETARDAQAQAQDLLGQTPDQARRLAQDAQQQAQALTEEGLEKSRAVAQKASDSVDQAARAAGSRLHSAASGIRSYAPEGGTAANITERFASGLDYTGNYLEQQSDSGIIASVIDFVRRYPIPTALAVVGVLFVLLRRLRQG